MDHVELPLEAQIFINGKIDSLPYKEYCNHHTKWKQISRDRNAVTLVICTVQLGFKKLRKTFFRIFSLIVFQQLGEEIKVLEEHNRLFKEIIKL